MAVGCPLATHKCGVAMQVVCLSSATTIADGWINSSFGVGRLQELALAVRKYFGSRDPVVTKALVPGSALPHLLP
jgi:hypothetical protein